MTALGFALLAVLVVAFIVFKDTEVKTWISVVVLIVFIFGSVLFITGVTYWLWKVAP